MEDEKRKRKTKKSNKYGQRHVIENSEKLEYERKTSTTYFDFKSISSFATDSEFELSTSKISLKNNKSKLQTEGIKDVKMLGREKISKNLVDSKTDLINLGTTNELNVDQKVKRKNALSFSKSIDENFVGNETRNILRPEKHEHLNSESLSYKNEDQMFQINLSDHEMNALGAKIIKAEIMKNTELANTLKKRLKDARDYRNENKQENAISDNITNFATKKISHTSIDLHKNTRFDIDYKIQARAKQENRHYTFSKHLLNCNKCIDSNNLELELMVTKGSTCYLTLPWHEGLQQGHCLIVPIQHVACSTELEADVWSEITNFRKIFTKIFNDKNMSVVFFELAKHINRSAHMVIHCIASKNLHLAPLYFKKAIEECENDWSTNKQLISLKDKSLVNSIPKGLPYFWVNFGMENGFAHVIEAEDKFPSYFAQEIIGNILNLNPQSWRKPRQEYNSKQKVKQLMELWKLYDCIQD